MAGLTPYPMNGYSPLRIRMNTESPDVQQRRWKSAEEAARFIGEASDLLINDFNVPVDEDQGPPAEKAEDYKAPETIQDWENAVFTASGQLEAYKKQLEQFIADTKSITPIDRASAAEVKSRARQIALARRDVAKMQESINQQRQQIQQTKDDIFRGTLQAELNDTYGSQIKAMAGKGLGAIGWAIEHSPLAGIVETLGGIASYGAERLGGMLDNKFADSGVNEGTMLEQLRDSPVSPSTWVAATGITPDSDVRKRGREFFKKAGQALGSFEKEVILTTPVWREFHEWNPVALTVRRPIQSAIEGAQVLGNPQTDISRFEFQQASQMQKDQARDMFYEMALMTAADPLNVVDFGGSALSRMGKLRKLAAVNDGALETAAKVRAIERVPGMAEKLGGLDNALEAVRGSLSQDLLKAGLTSDEASKMAKLYDELARDGFKEMRAMASADPRAWAANTDELLAKLTSTDAIKAQRDALKQMDAFEFGPTKVFGKQVSDGSKADPILGRTFREQAILGQRMKVWKAMYERFGDRPWFKAMGKPWAVMTGKSLLHDIEDVPELLDAYFAQRMFKADAGAEFLKFQQDVMEREASILNKFNTEQQAKILTELPAAVEHDVVRQSLRDPLLADRPLYSAVADLADMYDESAEALRTIQNRFNLDVADFLGPHGYFGREFSEEMQQWIALNPKARGMLFADETRRSRSAISTADVPEEKARKLRELDFAASEAELRAKLGVPSNIPIWNRDAFGVLQDRAQRAMHKAEIRNLYDVFIEAQAGKLDDATRIAMQSEIRQLLDEHIAGKQRAFEEAAQGYQQAAQDQQAFREGRKAVRQAEGAQGRVTAEAAYENQRAQDLRDIVNKPPVESPEAAAARGKAADASHEAAAARNRAAGAESAAERFKAEMRDAEKRYQAKKAEFEKAAKGGGAVDEAKVEQAKKAQAKAHNDYAAAQKAIYELESAGKNADAAKAAHVDATRRLLAAREEVKAAQKGGGSAASLKQAEEAMRKAERQQKRAADAAAHADAKVKAARQAAADKAQEAEKAKAYAEEMARKHPEHTPPRASVEGAKAAAASPLAAPRQEALGALAEIEGRLEGMLKAAKGYELGAINKTRLEQARKAIADAKKALLSPDSGNLAKEVQGKLNALKRELQGIMPAAEAKAFDKRLADMGEQLIRMEKAQGAAAKPVAQAVNARTREAASEFKQAAKAAFESDPARWSPKAKAEWLLGRLKDPRNLVHALAAGDNEISALEVLLKNKVDVPESWDELARLAATNITPEAEKEYMRLAQGMYWKKMDTPSKWAGFYDALKGFYQKQVLARLGSLAGDVRGTTINGMMAGLAPADLVKAQRRVGSFADWQAGKLASANARRLRQEGVLMTRALDTEQDASRLGEAIANLLPDSKRAQKLGELASKVEKKGFVGATLDALGLKGAGKGAEKYRNAILDYRNYTEDLNRVATYEKAIAEGYSHQAAVEEVYKYWGKFDELSKLEGKALNRIMFFWTWRARSIPVAVRHLLTHPVRSKWLLSMAAGNVNEKDRTPPWLRRMGAWMLGSGEDGKVKAINVGGSTYFDPLKSMLQGDFANMMLHGNAVGAMEGAATDFVRTLPPFVQAGPEFLTKQDYFTSKPWWRDAAHTQSNMKAPAFLWWFYSDEEGTGFKSAITDLLDLKPVVDESGRASSLTMNPYFAWMFGALPGADVHATDASAFFRPPQGKGERPQLDPIKGVMRQAGFPVYDVQLEDAKDQVRDFKTAIVKDAADLSGGSLYADSGGIYPDKKTWRGQEIRKFLEDSAKGYTKQGLTADQAQEKAFDAMRLKYPHEWRVMGLFKRVQAWEKMLIRVEEGQGELSKKQQDDALLLARRMDYDRLGKVQKKIDDKELKKLLK